MIGADLLPRNPARPLAIEHGERALDSTGFSAPLTALYRTTRLARASA
jgi:hypothetical protein